MENSIGNNTAVNVITMQQMIRNDILKGELMKQLLGGNHKMKYVKSPDTRLIHPNLITRSIHEYYMKCLEKFLLTKNKHIINMLELHTTEESKSSYSRIYSFLIKIIDNVKVWDLIQVIINIPDEEMTPEVIKFMEYILKVFY